jgi:hypothetical protein
MFLTDRQRTLADGQTAIVTESVGLSKVRETAISYSSLV